jgi:hypothetical protein
MLRFRFVFVVFYLTAVMVFAVYLRGANNRIFYEIWQYRVEQTRLIQELGNRQLLLEKLINPAAISQGYDQPDADK